MNGRTPSVIAFALLCSLPGFGQQNEITWQSQSIRDLRTNEEQPFTCDFKIYPGDHIEWIQGESVEAFNISSTEGNLPDNGPGTITYNVNKEGVSGKIIIERAGTDDTFLTLDLSEGTPLGAYYKFQVFHP